MMRQTEQALPRKQRIQKRILQIVVAMLLIAAAAVTGLGLYLQSELETQVPLELFRLSASHIPPKFFVYRFSDRTDRIGTSEELQTSGFGEGSASYLSYTELPQDLIHAFVSIEDKRFFNHRGVDWYRTAAAGVTYVLGFSDSFGASTITQQTVKNVTGKDQITLRRKLQEILYALDLERLLDKQEILELYLNVISFSDGCVGVGEAAQRFFSKAPSELTAAECASIAAMTNNPSYYHPVRHPDRHLHRRNLILRQMGEQGYLSKETCQAALDAPLELRLSDSESRGETVRSWYVDMVIEDVISDLCATYAISRSNASLWLHSGGLQIDIAMDPELQKTVEAYYESELKTPVNASGSAAQSALILLDSRTGDILAVAGAVGEKQGNRIQNYATQTLRPPGSAIKPISVYAPALEKGLINWASVYDDVPVNFGANNQKAWPKNANGVYRGLTNISYAVAHSTNTVAVRVLQDLGLRESFRFAKEKFHLTGLVDEAGVTDCDWAALALGQLNYGVTLRDLTAAYSVFADAGSYHPWRSYYRVLNAEGEVLLSSPDDAQAVLSPANAAIMTKLLQGVVENGTSSSITLSRSIACAGKTGTTQNNQDRWFVGYTPDLICGVWCGFEYPEPISGSNPCPDIWNTVMRRVCYLQKGRTEFSMPDDVIQLSYCRDSGELTADACLFDPRGSRTQTGWFTLGNQPHGRCCCHVLCQVDADGGIDCGHCPPDRLERVGLITVSRHFPIPVIVSDAQYVWGGDPLSMPPNPDPSLAYFDQGRSDFCGKSATDVPFNRSCTQHTGDPPDPTDFSEESRVPLLPPAPPDGSSESTDERNNAPPHRIW